MKKTIQTEYVLAFLNSGAELRIEAARLRYSAASIERRLEALEQAGIFSAEAEAERVALLSRLSAVRRLYAKKQRETEQRETEISMLIDALPTAAWRTVLRLRYGEGLRWCGGKDGHPCVLSGMAEAGLYYSERQMYRLHRKALEAAADLFETLRKQPSPILHSA